MSRLTATSLFILTGVAFAWFGTANAQEALSPQQKERQRLLDQLGLEKKGQPPAPPRPAPPAETEPSQPEPSQPGPPDDGRYKGKTGSAPRVVPFSGAVHRALMNSCKVCHTAGGPAGSTRFILSGNPREDHAVVRRFVNSTNARDSVLMTRAIGVTHGGGAVFTPDSASYRLLLRWIASGAALDAAASATVPPSAPSETAPTPPPQRPRHRPPTPPVSQPQPPESAADERSAPAVQHGESAPQLFAQVHLAVLQGCAPCHNPAGIAAKTRLQISGDPSADYASVLSFIDRNDPDRSAFVTKAAGQAHGGGAIYPEGSDLYNTIVLWVHEGAPGPVPVEGSSPQAPGTIAKSESAHGTAPHATGPPRMHYPPGAEGLPPGHPPLIPGLPGGITLNGRFDLNYERRRFSGNPFSDDGYSALQNYHRFVFLGRESTSDPLGFTAEILNLTLWEANYRIAPDGAPWRLWIKAGKLLVPFGAEPLFHQSYGGLTGFDQRVLPIIWAREGAGGHLLYRHEQLTLTADLYTVRGYRLRTEDGFLSLQNDFSTTDDTRFAVGQRLGAAWGPFSAYYSAYWNSLGFGRHLFMQALDLDLWRLAGVPVLENVTAAIGFLRADSSGGGPGLDYYNFASYFRLRYYPYRWIYFQYRQGLRTFGNRRGVIGDDTRWTSEDGSTHNFGVVARYYGASVGLYYYLLFEKADEVDDDFVRATVTYEF